MMQTVTVLGKFESSQLGSTTDNLFSEYNNFSVGYGLLMLLVDNIWTILLGLYLEQVMPKKFGRRRHPCFMFTCQFWGCGGNRSKSSSQSYDNKV